VRRAEDIHDCGVDTATAIVIATQGHDDEAAVRAALETPAGYVGLVASRKRAETTLGYLRDRGGADDQLARVHAPAGLDLGSIEHREIAVAVLADLVARRASGELNWRPASSDAAADDAGFYAVDPICGMAVEVASARYQTEHDGTTWFFCSP